MGGSGSSRGGELRQLQLGGPGASGALIGRGKKEAPAQLGRQGVAMAKELEPKEGPGCGGPPKSFWEHWRSEWPLVPFWALGGIPMPARRRRLPALGGAPSNPRGHSTPGRPKPEADGQSAYSAT